MNSEKKTQDVRIRLATPDDIDDLLKLILELAEYEKELHKVTATAELLRKSLFERRVANALLAFPAGPEPSEISTKPIGHALYFFNFSTRTGTSGLYLEDIYVKPEYRNIGIGKAFFRELGKIAQENDCPRIDWEVVKWNEPSIQFYDKTLGAKPKSEWVGMRLEKDGIEMLKTLY